MGKHKGHLTWAFRKSDKDGQLPQGYVRTLDDEHLVIDYRHGGSWPWQQLVIRRRDVEVLKRRLTQCMEATKH